VEGTLELEYNGRERKKSGKKKQAKIDRENGWISEQTGAM
jgi:hypothetical protein